MNIKTPEEIAIECFKVGLKSHWIRTKPIGVFAEGVEIKTDYKELKEEFVKAISAERNANLEKIVRLEKDLRDLLIENARLEDKNTELLELEEANLEKIEAQRKTIENYKFENKGLQDANIGLQNLWQIQQERIKGLEEKCNGNNVVIRELESKLAAAQKEADKVCNNYAISIAQLEAEAKAVRSKTIEEIIKMLKSKAYDKHKKENEIYDPMNEEELDFYIAEIRALNSEKGDL